MYIVRNALRNIARSKGRNILVGIIVFVIAISSCVALSIRQAASKVESQSLDNLKITGQISVNRESLFQNTQSATSSGSTSSEDIRSKLSSLQGPTLDELKTYASAPSVSSFYYTISSTVNANNNSFEPVDTSSSKNSSDSSASASTEDRQSIREGKGMSGNIPEGMGTQGNFSLTAYSSESAMTNFQENNSSITDGSMIDLTAADNTCLISDELASLNNLSVGNTITITNPNNDGETYTFTIIGIYHNSNTESTNTMMQFSTSSDPANLIIISTGTMNNIVAQSTSAAKTSTNQDTGVTSTTALRTKTSGTYVFNDVSAYESFQNEVKDMGLSDDYSVSSTDLNNYEQSLVPLKNLSKFAGIFLLIVLLVGGVVLIVLNIFNIHERKYEVGVLTAIGMKKGKVALQFVTELFTVTLVSIIIGTAVGAAISVPVTNSLLASQVASQQTQSSRVEQNFGRGRQMENGQGGTSANTAGEGTMASPSGFSGQTGKSVTNYISSVQSATDMTVVVELLGIGVLLTLISSLVAVIFILRYEPLKILTNRT
ncbi:ABC transporter permease [Caproicibacterium sp. BJN0003]|uniref:ABC transporter permease n=1 Tax=Caproicibacterium sp. BJN0003 TaxID=2994078 RepID=UPI00224E2FE1|nr:ABC transporter permease [Caproicibacterium sp. BJN0003]UZT83181.1 ABC transporter permease [Caproicibacterium sp. BJN0003]